MVVITPTVQLLGDVADLAVNRPSRLSNVVMAPMGVPVRDGDPSSGMPSR
jgi:hypothetical protein